MKNITKKLTGLFLGLSMVLGVGVIAGVNSIHREAIGVNAEDTTVSKSTNTLATEHGWTISTGSNVTCYTSWALDSVITISTTGTANCGSVWGTTTNDWRLYQKQNGNVIATAASGYTIVSVTYTYSINNSGTLKNGDTTVSSGTAVAVGASTITLTVGNTGSKTNGRVDITNFSVTYTNGTIEDTVSIDKIDGNYSVESGRSYSLTYTHFGNTEISNVIWTSQNANVIEFSGSSSSMSVHGSAGTTSDISVCLYDSSNVEICRATQTFTVFASEPAVTTKTVKEAAALCAGSSSDQTLAYNVTGRVTSVDNTSYGIIKISDGSTELTVYGCSGTSSALKWNGTNYVWSNPKDFSTNETTKDIIVGKVVTIKSILYLFGTTKEASGIVTAVKDDAIDSIFINSNPTKSMYGVGESFVSDGLAINVLYESGYLQENVTSGFTIEPATYTFTTDDAATGSKTFTVSYGNQTTDFNVSVTGERTLVSIAVKTNPTTMSYRVGQTFNSTGMVITLTYDDGTTAECSSGYTTDCDEYIFTEADKAIGSKVVTVNFEGKTTTLTVEVTEFLGFESGRYFIANSDQTVALTGAESSSTPIQTAVSSAVAFDFERVGDWTYSVSVTIDSTKYYLLNNSAADSGNNSQIRVIEKPTVTLASTNWVLDPQTSGDHAGTYLMKQNTTGSVYRYLSAFSNTSTSDWRGYVSTASGDPYIKIVEEKEMFRTNFMNTFTKACDSIGQSTDITALCEAWPNAATQFKSLSSANQTVIASATDEITARYDKIIIRYSADHSELTDFMSRSPSAVARINTQIGDVNTNDSITIIIIVSLVSITAIGGYFFIRKTKHE